MRFVEILREYNEQRLIHDFGKKLFSHWISEHPQNLHKDVQHQPDITYRLIQWITNIDPTPNKELTFWIANNYANWNNPKFNNGIKKFEDISSRAVPALLKFKALLRKPNLNPPLQIRDINQIKGLSQLENIVEKYPEEEAESNKEYEQDFYKLNQAELLYNSDILKVIVPKTEEASCYFGRGTRWCTAAKNNNMFHSYYKKDDPLYIVYIKGINEKYQFHFGSEQFMNSKDEEINTFELAEKYPVLEKIFAPISAAHNQLYFNNHPNKELQLAAVKKNGFAIKYIQNPTEKVQLAAVKQNRYAIQFIKNPSEEVQLAAVKQNGNAIYYIKNPTEEVQLAAVKQDGEAIRYIKNPSEEVQLAALNQNRYAIRYIKNSSEEVQLAAVKQDGEAIRYIKNPSEEVQLAAVKQDGEAIRYIKNPSEEVQFAAIKQSGYAIYYIKNPSEKLIQLSQQ